MNLTSIKWIFEVNPIMNVVHAKAIESNTEMQPLMFHSAVNIIEKAQKYNAKPYEPRPLSVSQGCFIVHFSLIFKNSSDMTTFFEQLQKEH